jgi:hypothetical protein
MKPDPNGQPVGDSFSRRLAELSAQLREEGVPPARDLWPDLDHALDRAMATGGRPQMARRGLARRGLARRILARGGPWLTAALAATVLVLVGLGVVGREPAPGNAPGNVIGGRLAARPAAETAPAAAAPLSGPAATRLGLRAVEAALDELQAALKQSPNDPDLSRLVLVIHHSRGRLLHQQVDSGVRDAFHGRN